MKQKIALTMFALWLLAVTPSKQTFALGERSYTAQDSIPTTIPETAVTMAERINTYRKELGLPAYYQDDALTQASQWVVDTMAVTEFISHFDDTGANPQQRAERAGYTAHVTEIIFGGFGGADAAWKWWTENELHNTILTSEDYVEFGVATAVSAQGRQFWAIMVGVGDGHYDSTGLIHEDDSATDMVTKLPASTVTVEITAVSATSTVTQPDPTATSEPTALVISEDNAAANSHNTANNSDTISDTFEENAWLIIAAAMIIIIVIAIFYFPRVGLNQKFKERT